MPKHRKPQSLLAYIAGIRRTITFLRAKRCINKKNRCDDVVGQCALTAIMALTEGF